MKHRSVEQWFLSMWTSPARAGLAAGAVYLLIAATFDVYRLGQSPYPHFIFLADAFLHGQLALIHPPNNVSDLTYYQGQYYLYWPPFPAVLFMPLVALFGTGVSDAYLTIAVGALNVSLVALLLKALNDHSVVELSPAKRAWLTVFFAFGTVHVTLAPYAKVWYTAQVVAFALLCGGYLAALQLPRRWAPLGAGALVACAFLSRNPTLLAAIWIAWYLLRGWKKASPSSLLKTVAAGLAPVALAVALTAGYNYLRFANPLETGLTFHLMAAGLAPDFQRYGAFSLHYVLNNSYYNFVAIPYVSLFLPNLPPASFWDGGSLFLMSPVFLFSFPGVIRSWTSHGKALVASCLAGAIPMLLIMGTGGWEFGPRYTLDFAVPLLIATAIGCAKTSTATLARLTMLSILIYLPGAILLGMKWTG